MIWLIVWENVSDEMINIIVGVDIIILAVWEKVADETRIFIVGFVKPTYKLKWLELACVFMIHNILHE